MKFELESEHYTVADVVHQALVDADCVAVTRAVIDGQASAVDALLDRLTGIGVPGLTAPAHSGGSELPVTDCARLIERLGEHLAPDTVALAVGVVCPALGRSSRTDVGDALLSDVAAGRTRVSVQDGWSGLAPWGADADLVAVVLSDSVVLTRPDNGHVNSVEGVDMSRRPARVSEDVEASLTLGADAAYEFRLRAIVASALQLSGVALKMIDLAAAHATTRTQFGTAIGSFQGVKHQLAEAFTAVEVSRRSAWWASHAIDSTLPGATSAAAMAKAMIGEASRQASYAALQIHGGIGYTMECDLHLWLKRAQVLEAEWGNTDAHWRSLRSAS